MTVCTQCNAESSDGMRFCGQCGHALGGVCGACDFFNAADSNFCGKCGESLGPEAAPARRSAMPERRQLTLVFCDLVNSVGLTSKLGEETWRTVLGPYQRICAELIGADGGRISRYFGDGVLAMFGYPEAGEDDAERALRAALKIVTAVASMDADFGAKLRISLRVRIGIASGTVVVGDIIGEGPSEEEAVIGEAINRAARLQSHAHPNGILIDDDTRSLVGTLFELGDGGRVELKGFEGARQVWEVKGERHVASHAGAVRRHLTALLGRDREMAHCIACWEAAVAGRGQTVAISGEPGVGKSRLVETLRRQVAGDVAIQLVLRGVPLFQNSAFHPLIEYLLKIAEIEPGHSAVERYVCLRVALGSELNLEDVDFDALAALVGGTAAEPDAAHSVIGPSAAEQRQLTLDVLRRLLHSLCAQTPLLLVIEDMQWLDPSTSELLRVLVDDISARRLFVVITHRSDFQPLLTENAASSLQVTRLADDVVRDMIRRIPGGAELSPKLVHRLVLRAEGIPLYVEELVVNLLERGGDDDIPVTLQASLTARLDRLGESRSTIRAASAIGREVPTRFLSGVTGKDEMTLRPGLQRAIRVGLLQPVLTARAETHRFKHALIQDAAYASLLREDRIAIHARIVEVLERDYAVLVAEHPHIVAHHLQGSNEPERAIPYLLEAGRSAAARFQNNEALAHLTRALRLVRRLPATEHNRKLELQLLIERGPVLINTRGVGRGVVRRNYNKALRLCEDLDEPGLHFAAYWGALRIDESYTSKLARTQGLLRLAEHTRDDGILLQAHHRQWATVFHMARLDECVEHARLGLEIYASGDFRDHGLRYAGHDPKVCGHGELALTYWLGGDALAADQQIAAALDWAAELDHPGTTAHALDIACMLARYARDVTRLCDLAERMQALAIEHRMIDHISKARIFIAWARVQLGSPIGAELNVLEREMEYQRANNTPEDFPVFYESLMEVLMMAGEFARANEVAVQAIEVSTQNKILYWGPELCRRRALLASACGEDEGVVADWLRRARSGAQGHGLWALDLRACRAQVDTALDAHDLERAVTLLDDTLNSDIHRTGPEVNAARQLRAQL